MSIIAGKPESNNTFEICPAGSFQAVCYGVHDIGWHVNGFGKKQHLIIICWEITETIKSEGEYKGKRFVISNRYNLSLHEKSILAKHLTAWSGQPLESLYNLDLEKLIGGNCMINIVHNTSKDGQKTFANVASIMKLPQGMEKIAPENGPEPADWIKELQKKGTDDGLMDKAIAADMIIGGAYNTSEDEVPFQ